MTVTFVCKSTDNGYNCKEEFSKPRQPEKMSKSGIKEKKFHTVDVDDANFPDTDSASADSRVTSWGLIKKPNQSGMDGLLSWSDCSMTRRYYNSASLYMHIMIRIPAAAGIQKNKTVFNALRGFADGLILERERKL